MCVENILPNALVLTRVTEKHSSGLSGLITTLFPTVSDAPIRLQGKALNHVFEEPSEIFNSIRKFYVNEVRFQ